MPLRRYFAPPGPLARLRWRLSLSRFLFDRNLKAYLVLTGLLAVKRLASRRTEIVSLDTLAPGQKIVVRTFPVKSAKERKQLLRGKN